MGSKKALQCVAHCPICELKSSKGMTLGGVNGYMDRKDTRCLGGRGHDGLHQCKKHAWGTLEQRAIELETVSHDKTGRYTSWFKRREQAKQIRESNVRRTLRSLAGMDD